MLNPRASGEYIAARSEHVRIVDAGVDAAAQLVCHEANALVCERYVAALRRCHIGHDRGSELGNAAGPYECDRNEQCRPGRRMVGQYRS